MIQLREVEDKDIIPLTEFLPRAFLATTREYWVHQFDYWWTANPAYTPQIPRGWVVENDTTIVGFLGNIPLQFLMNGEVRVAVAANSWYVDPSVRAEFGLQLFNEFTDQRCASIFLFKAEDASFRKILRKYKFKEHILPQSQQEYFYILNKKKVKTLISIFVLTEKFPQVFDAGKFFKRAGLLFFAYLHQKPVNRGGVLPKEAYSLSLCSWCDDAFYRLWERYSTVNIALSRDTKTLNWLFFSSGRSPKRVVIQCRRSRDSTLAGYMVFDLIRTKETGVDHMKLADICIENDDPQVLASLLSFAIDIGKKNNAAIMSVWADSPETERYFQSIFSLREAAQNYRYIRFSDTDTLNSGRDTHDTVRLPMMFPPQ